MRLLLFSNSTNAGEEYLRYTLPFIKTFLKETPKDGLFIPFAGISIGYDSYADLVRAGLGHINLTIQSVHRMENMVQAVHDARFIVVGGGNTFFLLKEMQNHNLLTVIREKIMAGTPYIGWSAGSNLACPTIKTTNDMPIVEPDNFNALNLIPFQINPHYTDLIVKGHAGETRDMRINEFILANKDQYVAGLREGSAFRIEKQKIHLLGEKKCKIFRYGKKPFEMSLGEDFQFLMQ
ncbi:MAG: dipeptidase PepE [Bacteroidales bacterium]|jgi:dipeptidase E